MLNLLIAIISILFSSKYLLNYSFTLFFYLFFLCIILYLYHLYTTLISDGLIISSRSIDMKSMPSRIDHDRRRMLTYPYTPIANTWYHLCDTSQLKNGKVIEVRALGLTLAIWMDKDNKPVVHDAFCLHLGANLGVGGKVVDGCIECPFHKWRFGTDGSIRLIPYVKNPEQCPKSPKLKVYPSVEWCGLIYMYYHADGNETTPEFQLPSWLPNQIEKEGYAPFSTLDIGHVLLTPIDWVDQAGDHAHFHTLHNEFLIPYTTIPFPDWIKKLIPLEICHQLVTYKGDDPDWEPKMKEMGMGSTEKQLIYFTDKAGLTWKGKVMETTLSETLETYIGPAMIAFHIPFNIGNILISFSSFFFD